MGPVSSLGFCGGWFIWCRWLPVVIVRGGGGRVPRRLRARLGFACRWRGVVGWCPYQCTHSAVVSTGGVDVLPGSLVADQLGLVQGVERLGQGKAGRSHPSTPPRRPPRTRTGPVHSGWLGTYAPRSQVVHQAREISPLTFPLPDGHSQGVQGQAGAHWPTGGLPADDPPGVHVGHESHIDPPREDTNIGGGTSRLRGNVGDPQPTRSKRLEVALDQVGRALLSRCAARGARGPGASDAARPQVCHEAFDGTTGHVTGTATLSALRAAPHHVYLAGPQHQVAGSCGPWISPP